MFLFLQWVLGENGALKAKLVHASTYQPPSLKGTSAVIDVFHVYFVFKETTRHKTTDLWSIFVWNTCLSKNHSEKCVSH